MSKSVNTTKIVLLLCAVICALYFIPAGSHPLMEPDEARYAEIPREMIESGNFITPTLNYVKYFEKPVLLYWMNAASFKVFGENDFAARFPNALAAILGIAATGLLGSALFGKRAGIAASVITATSLVYYAIGTINLTDMPLSFFITLAMAAFYAGHIKNDRRWYLLFYFALALATLTKGLVGIILPCGIIFWHIIFTRKWKLFLDVLYIPGIALFFAVSVPWFYLVCRENKDFFHFFFIHEHFLRYTTNIHDRHEPFWYFFAILPPLIIPWSGFLFSLFGKKSTLRSPASNKKKEANIFLLLWFGFILLFFSISNSKLIPYIVPCVPPLAILIGAQMDNFFKEGSGLGAGLVINIAISALFAAALLVFASIGKYTEPRTGLILAAIIAFALLSGQIAAVYFIKKKNDRGAALAALCAGALLFAACLQTLYVPVSMGRSVRNVADALNRTVSSSETIAVYGEYLHGIPFYTKRRIMVVNYMGELEFGAKQKEGEGWFPNREKFTQDWNAGVPFALAVSKKTAENLFSGGMTKAARSIPCGKHVVLFNMQKINSQ